MREQTVLRARNYVIATVIAMTLGAAISLYANLHKVNLQYTELASVVGRTIFQAIAAMRDWNTLQQGVYIPVTKDVRPNEYLVDPLRDITGGQGLQLTKINHAQMTRMVSELLDQERGIHVHITSLSPLRPMNAPDPWEKEALARFGAGEKEAYGVPASESGSIVFRYMAPLKAEQSCLNCHHEHRRLNEIRGGISVSFGFAPFQRLMDQSNRQIWILHLIGLTASLVPITVLGKKLVGSVDALQASLLRVRQLEGLVPICANCKKIRTEGSDPFVPTSWVPVEAYIRERTNAEFTHGICPECREKLYPGIPFRQRS